MPRDRTRSHVVRPRPEVLPWVAARFDGDGCIDAYSVFLLIDSCEPYLEQGAVICRDQDQLDGIVDEVSSFGLAGTTRW